MWKRIIGFTALCSSLSACSGGDSGNAFSAGADGGATSGGGSNSGGATNPASETQLYYSEWEDNKLNNGTVYRNGLCVGSVCQ